MEWVMAVVELWKEMYNILVKAIHEHGTRRDDSVSAPRGAFGMDLLLDTAHRALRRWRFLSRLLSSFQD